MFAQSALLAALAASAVLAYELFPEHQGVRRQLQARQTDYSAVASAEYACATALMPIYDTLPSLPPDIISYEITATDEVDCDFTFPPQISSELKSYEIEVSKWYISHSAEIASALDLCPQYSSELDVTETASWNSYCATATDVDDSTVTDADDSTATDADDSTATDADDSTATDADDTTATAAGTTVATTKATTTPAGKTTAGSEPTTPVGNTATGGTTTPTATANAGARETVFFGAAVAAAAGFLGVAIAL